MPSRLIRNEIFKPCTFLSLITTSSLVFLSGISNSFAVDYYGNGSGYANQQSYQSAPIYYPPVTRGDNPSSIVSVTNSKTGAHVVLGGTVVPYREVTLTAQLPGRVEYIAGEAGDWFDEGQVLVALEHDDVLAQRRQAIANLYGAQAGISDAQVGYTKEFWMPQAYKKHNRQLNHLFNQQFNRQRQSSPSMGYFPSMFEKFMGFGGGNPMGGGSSSNTPITYFPDYDLQPWIMRDLDLYSHSSHVDQAQSQIYGARSKIDEIDAHLRDARSISPFEGVIVDKIAEEGDTVQPGQPLIKYADTRYLQLEVQVPARLVSALSKDVMVPAKLDVGDTYTEVRVAQIYPTADSERHTVTVKFDLPSGVPGGPGMYAEVMIPDVNTPIKDMPVIPSTAVIHRGSLPAVFVLNQNNEAELRLIRLGEQVDRNHVAVLSGVRPGEQVFASPPPGIRSGWSPSPKKKKFRKRKKLSDED
ncbi:MAG: efflux RND transporter periplasmic adaptor subunit [Gammaproteobacteria bacterium]|nr:efflux RND transporter periplasmic adaptor subunit [Gammaproteobacteria bacterium]